MAVDEEVGEGAEEAGLEVGAEGGDGSGIEEGDGFGEAEDAGEVFGAGAEAVFLRAAGEEGGEFGAEVEGADAFGAVEFVGAEGERGDAVEGEEGLFADVGDGVDEERDVVREGDLGEGGEVDFDAGFAVGGGEDEGGGVGADGGGDGGGVGGAREVNGEIGDVEGEGLEGAVDGGVFDGGGDDVGAGREAAEEEVDALGAARGEEDVGGRGVEVGGYFFTGGREEVAGALAERVDARGIRWRSLQVQEHGLEHSRVERGRRVVV